MGTGTRIFLVHDDDSIERLSIVRFERLTNEDPNERLPQYAGKKIRYALVILETKDRKPVDILYIEHSFLFFDADGRLDPKEKEIDAKFAADMIPPFKEEESKKIIDAKHRFVQKRYADHYRWEPTQEIATSIIKAILG